MNKKPVDHVEINSKRVRIQSKESAPIFLQTVEGVKLNIIPILNQFWRKDFHERGCNADFWLIVKQKNEKPRYSLQNGTKKEALELCQKILNTNSDLEICQKPKCGMVHVPGLSHECDQW